MVPVLVKMLRDRTLNVGSHKTRSGVVYRDDELKLWYCNIVRALSNRNFRYNGHLYMTGMRSWAGLADMAWHAFKGVDDYNIKPVTYIGYLTFYFLDNDASPETIAELGRWDIILE